MNRIAKNVLMVVLAVILAAGMIFTVSYAAKSNMPPQDASIQQMQMRPGGDNKNSSNDRVEPNNQNGSDDQTESKSHSNSNDQQGQPPQMPNENGRPPQMPGNGQDLKISSIDHKYYPILGAAALAFALIMIYLIMSRGNKRTFAQTFRNRDKILIFILAVILACGCLTQTAVATGNHLKGSSNKPDQQMQLPGDENLQNGEISEANGATTVDGTEEALNDTYTSSNADENAILVTGGGTLTSDGATISKKSGDSSNTGESDFSGVNAALLVNDNSTATIKNAKITTSAKGANGVFATGEKSKITISDSSITTSGDSSSRGLDATYGGTIEASNVKIKTQGGSCAAMATDRGEGTVTATNSTFETNGAGSPVIYSTGNISMKDSTGTANGAQITVVEGKNSATIENSKVSCSAAGNRGDVDIAGVMIYQSMSGDASEGTGNFTASDSVLTIDKNSSYFKTAPMFFVTNTDAVIKLTNTDLDYGSNILLSAKGTSEWGNAGSNGGTVTLDAAEQTLSGNVQLDDISSLTMNMTKGTSYTGTINADNSAKAININLDKTSKIKLTGDSYVSSLKDDDASYSNIDFNGYKLYVDGKAIN